MSVNVGPIVRALKFLTEGRGDDRGTDEAGNPLPDLMSLAFDVVESIILGGRKADYFRQVKLGLEAMDDGVGRSSLGLAKHASRLLPRYTRRAARRPRTGRRRCVVAGLAGAVAARGQRARPPNEDESRASTCGTEKAQQGRCQACPLPSEAAPAAKIPGRAKRLCARRRSVAVSSRRAACSSSRARCRAFPARPKPKQPSKARVKAAR